HGFDSASFLGVGEDPASIAVGDFDRDGNPDLAIADAGGNHLLVGLGDGSGGFKLLKAYGTGIIPVSVAAGDFNGDGAPDLAVADADSGAAVLLNHSATRTLVGAVVPTSVSGQVVSFSAIVSRTVPGLETPTGMVAFWDGGTFLGARSLNAD